MKKKFIIVVLLTMAAAGFMSCASAPKGSSPEDLAWNAVVEQIKQEDVSLKKSLSLNRGKSSIRGFEYPSSKGDSSYRIISFGDNGYMDDKHITGRYNAAVVHDGRGILYFVYYVKAGYHFTSNTWPSDFRLEGNEIHVNQSLSFTWKAAREFLDNVK